LNNFHNNIGRPSNFILLMLMVATIGCGDMSQAPIDVSGQISIAGKPLNQGSVIFTDQKGERAYGEIQPDGSFSVPQIMPGTFRVSVSVPQRRRPRGETPDPVRGTRPMPVAIPTRYSSVDSSGLQFEIVPEKPELTIELER